MLLLLEEPSENLFIQQPMTMLGPSNSVLNNLNSVHLSENTGEHGKIVHKNGGTRANNDQADEHGEEHASPFICEHQPDLFADGDQNENDDL